MTRITILLCLLLVGLESLEGRRVRAAELPPDVDRIVRDWAARRQQTKSVSYRLSGRGVIPKGSFTNDFSLPPQFKGKDVPSSDHRFDLKMSVTIDFAKKLARNEIQREVFYPDMMTFAPYNDIKVFDGKDLKSIRPRETNDSPQVPLSESQPSLWENIHSEFFFSQETYPVFYAHGRIPVDAPNPTRLDDSLDPSALRWVGFGEHSGRKCAILRVTAHAPSESVNEFWVDEERKSAVVRWRRLVREKLIFDTNIRYAERDSGWWPEAWDWTSYDLRRGGAVRIAYNLRVTDFHLNPPTELESFQAKRVPGTVVHTGKKGELLPYYKVQEDGSLTRYLFEHERPKTAPGRGSRTRWVLLIVAGLLGALAVGVWFWRRRPSKA